MDWSTLAGRWTGTWRTWVEPDELYSEGPIDATVEALYDGKGALIRYTAVLDGDVAGIALVGRTQEGPFVAWMDSWHTSGLVMDSRGSGTEQSLAVATTYRADDEEWHWSSEYSSPADGRLVIRHYNEGPGLPRYLGVEAVLERPAAS